MIIKRKLIVLIIIIIRSGIFLNVFAQKAPIYFTDVGNQAGVENYLNSHGTFFFDYNNDGWDDIFVIHNVSVDPDDKRPHALFKSLKNGKFSYATAEAGVQGYYVSAQGVAAGDYNNDGDIDFCIGMGNWRPVLYRNNLNTGDSTFTNVASQVGVYGMNYGRCLEFVDFDNDGFLDVLILGDERGDGIPVALYKNNKDGTFYFYTYQSGLYHERSSDDIFGFAFGDIDNDGDVDLFIPNQTFNSRFYINNGNGTFSNATSSSGLPQGNHYRGAVFLDYDNDGYFDLFARREGMSAELYRNNKNGTFTNVSYVSGVYSHVSWAAFGGGLSTGDFDNDGYIDILIVSSYRNQNSLFQNNGNGTFTDVASEANIRVYSEYWSAPLADYDHDGYLDIYFGRNGGAPPQFFSSLYRNSGGKNNHWLHVKLVGGQPESGKSNRSGVGARVVAYANGHLQMRQVLGGCSYKVDSFPVEFGLGYNEKVDSLIIYWPSSEISRIYDIPADTLIAVGEFDGFQYFHSFSISGGVVYYTQKDNVPNVKLVISGDESDSSNTNSLGLYKLPKISGGVQISIVPEKPSGEDIGNNVITAWDAYLAASYCVGSDTLSTYQRYSADVDKNDMVELIDAAFIARHAVGLIPTQNDNTGKWQFSPSEYHYPLIVTDYVDQDFTAFVLGDVSGNWSPNEALPKTGNIEVPSHSIPLSPATEEWVIPIRVEETIDLFAADIWLRYDPQKLQILDIVPAEKFGNFYLVYNEPSYGLIKIVMYGTQAVSLPGELVQIIMEIIDSEMEQTEIQCEKFLINEIPIEMGSILISTDVHRPSSKTVLEYRLDENYPNPFNPDTEIQYTLKNPGRVSLKIYDIQGRQIRTLMNVFQTEGSHVVIWDGKDDHRKDVPSGVYFCRLISGSYTQTIRMIKTK